MKPIVNIAKVSRNALAPAKRAISPQKPKFWLSATLLLIGCAPGPSVPAGSTSAPVLSAGGTTGVTANENCSGGTVLNIAGPSIYLVQAGHEPYSVLVFPQSASGATAPTAEIPGTLVSLDGAGDMFVLTGSCIVEYPSALSSGSAARFLPVGPGTKISAVNDMAVSASGQIYVSDGKGIAVFDSAATGDAGPTRYILPAGITPGQIAVDSLGNLYVVNAAEGSVAVFGPTATGSSVPDRVVTGRITVGSHITLGIATDSANNLYVLCVCGTTEQGGNTFFGAYEFSLTAKGDAAPIRGVTSDDMYPWSGGPGLAVDSAGVIYITAGPLIGGSQTIFEFAANVSGNVHPTITVTSPSVWTDTLVSHIAVH